VAPTVRRWTWREDPSEEEAAAEDCCAHSTDDDVEEEMPRADDDDNDTTGSLSADPPKLSSPPPPRLEAAVVVVVVVAVVVDTTTAQSMRICSPCSRSSGENPEEPDRGRGYKHAAMTDCKCEEVGGWWLLLPLLSLSMLRLLLPLLVALLLLLRSGSDPAPPSPLLMGTVPADDEVAAIAVRLSSLVILAPLSPLWNHEDDTMALFVVQQSNRKRDPFLLDLHSRTGPWVLEPFD
jgi:hypothetical protein